MFLLSKVFFEEKCASAHKSVGNSSLQTRISYRLMVTILLVLTVKYVINYGQTKVGYVFMIASYARKQAEQNPESWRGAQRPTIGADELQNCGLTVSLKMSIFHSFITNTAEKISCFAH